MSRTLSRLARLERHVQVADVDPWAPWFALAAHFLAAPADGPAPRLPAGLRATLAASPFGLADFLAIAHMHGQSADESEL